MQIALPNVFKTLGWWSGTTNYTSFTDFVFYNLLVENMMKQRGVIRYYGKNL